MAGAVRPRSNVCLTALTFGRRLWLSAQILARGRHRPRSRPRLSRSCQTAWLARAFAHGQKPVASAQTGAGIGLPSGASRPRQFICRAFSPEKYSEKAYTNCTDCGRSAAVYYSIVRKLSCCRNEESSIFRISAQGSHPAFIWLREPCWACEARAYSSSISSRSSEMKGEPFGSRGRSRTVHRPAASKHSSGIAAS